MGITGLLPFLKKASSNCHVRRFSGCTVAIDAYCWLHKGAFGCADKLGKGEPTTAYVTYCLKYINILLSHNIKPILVLDGRNLPSKASTEKKRREKRDENRKNAKEFLKKGMTKEAWECFTRCVDITPAMARQFIKTLREMKIDYVIAPYEADAQLAYMARNNIVDIVITEDSDLVLFGCPKIFFKMNINGDGVLFDQAKIPVCMGVTPEQFHFERFRWMCILSGCDYLASLPGIGLGRAKKIIDGSTSRDIRKILKCIPRTLRLDIEVPEDYIQGFIQAENTFLYQLVFDTISRRMVPLTPYAADVTQSELVYAGSYISDRKLALDMALGNVDIHTLKQVDNFDPAAAKSGYNHQSIWSPHYTISSTRRLVTARDLKKATKHTPTVGMQVNISCNSVIKKRSASVQNLTDQEDEVNYEDIVSMYGSKEEPSASASTSGGTPEKENDRKASKRHRKSTDSENSASENDEKEVNKSPARKRINPFLKFSKSNTNSPKKASLKAITDSALNAKEEISLPEKVDLDLVCLIQKNKIYDDDDKNIIVKSQYFRHSNAKRNCPVKEEKISTVKTKPSSEANFDIFIQSDGDTDSGKTSTNPKLAEDSEGLSQLSIYSILEDELENMGENDSQKLSDRTDDPASQRSPSEFQPPLSPENLFTLSPQSGNPDATVITLDDCDLNSESNIGEIKLTLRNSPVAATTSNNISKSSFSTKRTPIQGTRKKQGLFRSGTKVDPKQKTLSSMFALQQKPKL